MNWSEIVDEISRLAGVNVREALSFSLSALPKVIEVYGVDSPESAYINHKIGILGMLMEDYDIAEEYMLAAFGVCEKCGANKLVDAVGLAKHLGLLYEAKARALK